MNLTYEAAFNELKELAAEMESEQVSVDELAEKLKRASMLIKFCQDKLRSTEAEVNQIISSMGPSQP